MNENQSIRRLGDLSPAQWKAGVAAWLGWLFDGLDMHLYTVIAAPFVAKLLEVPPADKSVGFYSSWIQAAFLFGWAIGGAIFGRLGDRFGYRRVFAPCLVLITAGIVLLAVATSRAGLILSAVVFGIGFGTAYPVFAAYVTHGVSEHRRGAAFGAILAAFDTGIGTGSSSLGWLVASFGYPTAFGVAAALSALALPAFLLADRQVGLNSPPGPSGAGMTAVETVST